jgi:hypothetical protein
MKFAGFNPYPLGSVSKISGSYTVLDTDSKIIGSDTVLDPDSKISGSDTVLDSARYVPVF